MSFWEWLDISPTSDIREIKSAYARAAKRYHPEEHPEQFKELQKAYKRAVQYAKLQSRVAETGQKSQNLRNQEEQTLQKTEDRPGESTKETAENRPKQQAEERQETLAGRQAEPAAETEIIWKGDSVPEAAPDMKQPPETVFDFSGIDSYGDKEQFFRCFYLLVYNPYLINNRIAWNSFLCLPSSVLLFHDPFFRKEFVLALCGVYGLKKDTILYFEQYLLQFHRPEFAPEDGTWETSFPCFLKLKRRRFWSMLLGSGKFRGREGKLFQNQVMSALHRQKGQISFDRRQDVEAYMRVYLSFARDNEEKLAHLYRKRKFFLWDTVGLPVVILIFFALTIVVSGDREKDGQENYLRAIQIQQESEEKDAWIRDKAQSDLDRVIRDWQKWEKGLDETHRGNTDTERHRKENGGAFFQTWN